MSKAEPSRTGSDLVVECLVAEGVDVVAGVPGTTVMDLIDSLARQGIVRFLHTRHEQVAGLIADGLSRAGGLGVALVSRGPGAANAAVAVHNAYDESVPMLLLVGQVPAGITARRSFEEMDVVGVFSPMSKWAVEVHQVNRIPELLQRAVRTAVGGRPGPVVVSLPLDVLQATVPDGVGPAPRARAFPPGPAPRAVAEAAELLTRAERPAVVVGGGAAGATEAVTRVTEQLGAPLVTTWLRQSTVSHDHESYLGALGYGAHEVTEEVVRDADVLLALGCRFSEFSTKRWTLLSTGTRIIHVDIDPGEIGKIYLPAVGMVSDAGLAASALADALPSPPVERVTRLASLRERYVADTSLRSPALADDDPAGKVSSAALVAALQEVAVTPDHVIVQDAPSFGPWSHRYLRLPRAHSFVGSAGGAMAWGFPAGLGIALRRPATRVVTVSGDGSFWMVAQDLETAVREGISTVNVVVNNDSYGNTRDRQRSAHGGRYLGVFYGNPDFAEFARSLGAFGARATTDGEVAPALRAALDQDLPAVVEVVQDQMYGLPPGLLPPAAR